jgi:glutamate racemase
VYNLSYQYDKEGYHEQKQRDLRERIQTIKARDQSNADTELIERDPTGQIVMQCSHFDFIEKPFRQVSPKKFSKNAQAKEKIAKAFNKLLKEKREGF